MNTVFTYGSLMFAPVWKHVVRGKYANANAQAPGVRRGSVPNEQYPGCVRDAHASTVGRAYLNVDASDLKRLDTFEGAHYWREAILVKTENGQSMSAWIYLYRFPNTLTPADWSPERFERDGMAKFLAHYTPTTL